MGVGAPPTSAVVNYSPGAVIANTAIIPVAPGVGNDFSIFSLASSHVVVDVLGYYSAPVATALDCISVNSPFVAAAVNTWTAIDAVCPAGRTVTGGGHFTKRRLARVYAGVWLLSIPSGNAWRIWVDNRDQRSPEHPVVGEVLPGSPDGSGVAVAPAGGRPPLAGAPSRFWEYYRRMKAAGWPILLTAAGLGVAVAGMAQSLRRRGQEREGAPGQAGQGSRLRTYGDSDLETRKGDAPAAEPRPLSPTSGASASPSPSPSGYKMPSIDERRPPSARGRRRMAVGFAHAPRTCGPGGGGVLVRRGGDGVRERHPGPAARPEVRGDGGLRRARQASPTSKRNTGGRASRRAGPATRIRRMKPSGGGGKSMSISRGVWLAVVTGAVAITGADSGRAQTKPAFALPRGLQDQEMAIPADNPLTAGQDQARQAALLRQAALEDKAMSCERATFPRRVDRRPGALAEVRRRLNTRHTPTLYGVALLPRPLLGRPRRGPGGADPGRVEGPDGRRPRRDREGRSRRSRGTGPFETI